MKMTEDRQEVLVGGAQSVDSFTIKASASAFKILSSNLYANKIGAVIRELSCNCYDAHVSVDKKDEPFLITLPNSIDPTFKIRDYGPGLSGQEIHQVYTTFFESTKTDSNDFIGALGLGSKSPFGVADSFTITSYHNNTKTIYSAFLNDARIPSIAKFAEMETDEESGILIEVAIKEDDFYTFNKEVNNQLKYFKVKPIIKGNSDFEWNADETYLYEGTDWKMAVTDYSNSNPRVIQGQVQYPINTTDMGRVYSNASKAVQSLLERPILFNIPLGSVNIAPSREALSYDERTSQNIIDAATKILTELPQQIKEAINDAPTEYEAKLKYESIMSDLGGGYYGRDSIADYINESGEILWKGKDVSSRTITIDKDDIISAVTFTKSYNNRFQKNNHSVYADSAWEFTATDMDTTVWVLATPSDKAVEGRSKQYTNNNHGKNVKLHIIKTNLTARKFANRLGLKADQITLAATLDKVKRFKTTSTGKKEISVQKLNCRYGYNKVDQWDTTVSESLSDFEGYYVHLDRYDVSTGEGVRIDDLKKMISGAIHLGIITDDDKVYGLRKMNQQRTHNLVDLFSYIGDNIDSHITNDVYDWGNSSVIDKIKNNIYEIEKIQPIIEKDSPMSFIINALIEQKESTLSFDARQLIDFFQASKGIVVDMKKTVKELDERYPMIGHIGYYLNIDDIASYILQVDTLYKLTGGDMPTYVAKDQSKSE